MAEQTRRGLDGTTLLFGIGSLIAAAVAVTDGTSWFPDVDPRLVLAGAAVLVGLLLLAGALRRPRR